MRQIIPATPKPPASLLRQIIVWTFLALLILVGVAGGISYKTSYHESADFQKDNLKNIAKLIANNSNSDDTPANQYYQTDDNDGLLRIDIWQKNDAQKSEGQKEANQTPLPITHAHPDALTFEQLQHLQRLSIETKIQTGLEKLSLRVKRNQDLVEQLLTLARLNTSQDNVIATPILPLIEQAINLLLPIIDHKHIELTVDVDPVYKNLSMDADATMLLLLIKNILQNAVLYTPEHGQVSIIFREFSHCSSEIKNTSVGIIGKQKSLANFPSQQPMLQILDTGSGISPEQYHQAFEPFIRLSQTISDNSLNRSDSAENNNSALASNLPKGTGLGLAMVKSICEQTGISLFLAPALNHAPNAGNNISKGQGLCVTLILPRKNG